MNSEKEKDLDDLFKKKLADPVDPAGYNDGDWAALEQMLNRHQKPRGIVYWLPVFGSAAAVLLLFFGYLVFRQHAAVNHHQTGNSQAANHQKAGSGTNGAPTRQQTGHPLRSAASADIAKVKKPGSGHNPFPPFSRSGVGPRGTGGPEKAMLYANTGDKKDVGSADLNTYERSGELLAAATPSFHFGEEKVAVNPGDVSYKAIALARNNQAVKIANAPARKIKPVSSRGYRPQFALSVLAAPDINGVGSFQQSKVGTNEGLLFSAGVSRKFTLSTGVIYSVKPYITNFENYHTPYQFQTNPVNITADCRMLDIPLNIGYQLYNRHQNKISVGTGLSSYIMLHESYKFNYANTYIDGPSQYTVPGSNGYFFGVLNLNATFQRQVSPKVGISLQPYVKLPLTNIGYSQVRLQTTGVALGLTWNINSLSKP